MADKNLVEVTLPPELEHAQLGALLLAARNAKKLTQKDVSNSLRISITQITALETNDFGLLPDAMVTRGFIRNYARLLEIDAEPLLASYRAQIPDKTPGTLSVKSSMYEVMSGKDSQPWLIYILSSILVLLFLLAWLFYVDYMPKPVTVAPPQSLAVVPPAEVITLPEAALPAAERQSDAGEVLTGINTLPANSAEVNASSVTSNLNSATPLASAAQSPSSAQEKLLAPVQTGLQPGQLTTSETVDFNTFKANAAQSASNVKVLEAKSANIKSTEVSTVDIKPIDKLNPKVATKKVSITVDEETWVRVSDKSGAVVFQKLMDAGSADGFNGEPPFNILVGNAKATKLMFLGKHLDLTNYTKNNVARINLE